MGSEVGGEDIMREVFTHIYRTNFWKDKESVSGQGSNLKQTETIRRELPKLFKQLHMKSVLDIPCGDFYWFRHMDLLEDVRYMGADVVPELIDALCVTFPFIQFQVMDATTSVLPQVDLILCRDMLGHFSNVDVRLALKNFRLSGSKYLLATTFPDRDNVRDIETGQWRPINLAQYFGLPDPITVINEHSTEGNGKFADKSLGLWEL